MMGFQGVFLIWLATGILCAQQGPTPAGGPTAEVLRIEGRVTDLLNEGLAARVKAEGLRDRAVEAGPDGRFAVSLRPGNYRFEFRLSGFLTVVLPDVSVSDDLAQPLIVVLQPESRSRQAAGLESTLIKRRPRAGHGFELRLQDLSEQPVGGAEVSVRESDRKGAVYRLAGYSNGEGILVFPLSEGPYDIQIVSGRHHFLRIHYVRVAAEGLERLIVVLTEHEVIGKNRLSPHTRRSDTPGPLCHLRRGGGGRDEGGDILLLNPLLPSVLALPFRLD